MTVLDLLASDAVSIALLLVGVPACAFLVAYAATIWRGAASYGVRVRTFVYILGAAAGLTISLFGVLVASASSDVATSLASPDDFTAAVYTYGVYAFVVASLVWPLGWCALPASFLLFGWRLLGWPVRVVLVALVVGFLSDLVAFVGTISVMLVSSNRERVLFFFAVLASTITVTVLASRRSRVQVLPAGAQVDL